MLPESWILTRARIMLSSMRLWQLEAACTMPADCCAGLGTAPKKDLLSALFTLVTLDSARAHRLVARGMA